MATESGPCGKILSLPVGSPERQAAIDKCFAQKKAQKVKQGMKMKPMAKKPTSKEGTGGPDDPAWKGLANLAKNGLPG